VPKTTVTLMVDTDDPDLQQVIAEILALPEWSPQRVSLMVELMRAEADRLVREMRERETHETHETHETNGHNTERIPVVRPGPPDPRVGRHRSD
jgi:hypothetical protein